MADGQTKKDAPSDNEIMQQGYRDALFALRNSIEDYKHANEAALPSVITDIRQHLLNADKATVQKLFGGATTIRSTSDENFTLGGQDVPDEIRGLTIPKKIFTQDITAKRFFSDYDRINFDKQQSAAQAEAAAKAEGAATKLDAVKQAMLGKGFGGVGQVLAGTVGIKTGARAAAAQAPSTAEKSEEPKTEKAKTAEGSAETEGKNESRTRRAPSRATEKAESEENKKGKEEAQAALETIQKMRKVPDTVAYQKRFTDILGSLETSPDPFSHDGAAFYEIRHLKKDVDKAAKTQALPELKNLYDRLDELGSEYRTSQLEQRQGKDGKTRLRAALRDIRTMAGLPPTTVAPLSAVPLATAAAVGAAAVASTAASLGKQAAIAAATPISPKSFGERISQIEQREMAIGNRLEKIRSEDKALRDVSDKDPKYQEAFRRRIEIGKEDKALVDEFKRMVSKRQALQDLRKDMDGEKAEAATSTGAIGTVAGVAAAAMVGTATPAAASSGGQIPHLAWPIATVGLAGAALGGASAPAGATAMAAAPAGSAIRLEAEAKQIVSTSIPVIPPPPSAISQVSVPPPPVEVQVQAEIENRAVLPAPPPATPGSPEETMTREPVPSGALGAVPLVPKQALAQGAMRDGAGTGRGTRGQGVVSAAHAPGTVKVARPSAQGPIEAIVKPQQTILPGKIPIGIPGGTGQDIMPEEEAAPRAFRAAQPVAPSAGGEAEVPSAPRAPAPRGQAAVGTSKGPMATPPKPNMPSAAARTGVAGMAPVARRAAAPVKGYRSVGPQEIKPPMGRGLELTRAMGLGAAQTAAGRAAGEAYGESYAPEEGLELSSSGLEEALGSGAEAGPSLPVQFGEFYNPLEARHRMAEPASPGFIGTEPTAETEASQGGVMESELDKAQALSARQQSAMVSAEQLVGTELLPSAKKEAGRKSRAEKAPARAEGRPVKKPSSGRTEELGPISRLLSLQAKEQTARNKLAQAKQRIEELKAQYEQIKKGVQTFRNLKNAGELLSGISVWTLLALWAEWNLDIINKRLANGMIPYLEKPPSPNASTWDKGLNSVKDGVTILADIIIPINLLMTLFGPIVISVVIVATVLSSAAIIIQLVVSNLNW